MSEQDNLPVIDDAFHQDVLRCLPYNEVPAAVRARLQASRSGKRPWAATLTPAELMIVRSHGLRPIAAVCSTCWLHYGFSWTRGHAEGWNAALRRLKREAYMAGANAVLDVKMRTIPLGVPDSMDFSLIGTAVYVEGLSSSEDPVVATIPALEFVKLLEADVVPTGVAIGADYRWLSDWNRSNSNLMMMGNIEARSLSALWSEVRDNAHQDLRRNAREQGNGVLAHLNFSQGFKVERQDQPPQYLARHIVVATTVDARRGTPLPHDIKIVVDLHQGRTPLTGTSRHHQSYSSNESEGAI